MHADLVAGGLPVQHADCMGSKWQSPGIRLGVECDVCTAGTHHVVGVLGLHKGV